MSFKKNTPGSFYIWQRIIHAGKQTPGIRLMVALNLKFTKRKNKKSQRNYITIII